MDAKLVVITGKASKRVVDLKLPTVIGRSRAAGLTIAHPMVSRQHCELFEEEGLLIVRDLGSTNGTFLDGRRIDVAPLLPNAQFTIGPLTFRAAYRYAGDPALVPPPTFLDAAPEASAAAASAEEPDFMADEEAAEPVAFEERLDDGAPDPEPSPNLPPPRPASRTEPASRSEPAPHAAEPVTVPLPAADDLAAPQAGAEELLIEPEIIEAEVVEVEPAAEAADAAEQSPPPPSSPWKDSPKPAGKTPAKAAEPESAGIDSFLGGLQ